MDDIVQLTPDARSRFPDIATRAGTVKALDGWIVVEFSGLPMVCRVPAKDLELA